MFATFLTIFSMRINQVMLQYMVNAKVVGEYSAASKLTEVLYLAPVVVSTSLFPTIISNRESSYPLYLKRMQAYYSLMTWMALIPALFIAFFSSPLISLLYGKGYESSADILAVQVWTTLFVFFGTAKSRWFIMEGMQNFALVCSLVGGLLNVLLNLLLIPKYSGLGAAWATFFSQAVMIAIIPCFYLKDRKSAIMFIKSFNPKFIFKIKG